MAMQPPKIGEEIVLTVRNPFTRQEESVTGTLLSVSPSFIVIYTVENGRQVIAKSNIRAQGSALDEKGR